MKSFIVNAGSSVVGSRWRLRGAVVMLTVGLGAMSSAAMASSDVSGSAESVTVDAQNSSIKDVLAALGQKFGLEVQSSANLDKQISGAYHGSLRRVIARLLEGYNFVIQSDQGKIQVTVLGTENGPTAIGARVQSGANAASTVIVKQGAGAAPGRSSTIPSTATPASPATPAGASAPAVAQAAPGTSKPTPPAASSSAAPFELKVAEGGPAPTPGAATTSGPVPKPATGQLPTPTASSAMPSLTPTPPSGGAVLPMPTGSKPFPGMNGSTSQPPAASSASNGAPAPAPAAPAPTPSTTK